MSKIPYVNRNWLENEIESLIEECERAIDDDRLQTQPHVFTWYYAKRKALSDVMKILSGNDAKWIDDPLIE